MRTLKIYLAVLIVILLAGSAWSEARNPELESQRVARSIMSPFCPGLLLSDCPSGKASELKDQIRDWFASGETDEQVMSRLYGKFGQQLNPVPPTSGFGLLAWVIPFIFLAAGAIVLVLYLRRQIVANAESDLKES